jgi:hypothetical protein
MGVGGEAVLHNFGGAVDRFAHVDIYRTFGAAILGVALPGVIHVASIIDRSVSPSRLHRRIKLVHAKRPPRQRLPSDGFFERAPQSLFRSTLLTKGAPPKKH